MELLLVCYVGKVLMIVIKVPDTCCSKCYLVECILGLFAI